ncbi:DUF5688 family protein [Lachnospiraceae bacterium OttesenSCG-928-D06]|nr:DUF5688 family protein [Lachnospiraceae bacterium OttesenSCG-928-D06]
MDYKQFKESIVAALQDFYGKGASVIVNEVLKNNGTKYDGINILLADSDKKIIPTIYFEGFYSLFSEGNMTLEDCVSAIIALQEENEHSESVKHCAMKIREWEDIKGSVYPILLSTEGNEKLLDGFVTDKLLDLSIVYTIRLMVDGCGLGNVKISKQLFEQYGITKEMLHEQALYNLKNDRYQLRGMEDIFESFLTRDEPIGASMEPLKAIPMEPGKMYVLTNAVMMYGAAGILNKSFLKEISGGRDFIILPSSVHETIFIPVDEKIDLKEFDNMVEEVNATQVHVEEQLASHCYYYAAQAGEIQMCV